LPFGSADPLSVAEVAATGLAADVVTAGGDSVL